MPVYLETDVRKWGCAQNLDTCIYITIGTGVGLGILVHGKPIHGLVHPDDSIRGICSYHEACLEGLVCGSAIEKRCNKKGIEIDDDAVWNLIAHYIGIALANFICTLSPQKIILEGGIMKRDFLFAMIRCKVKEFLSDYTASDVLKNHIETYIVPPNLKYCGVLGGICVAQQEREQQVSKSDEFFK